MAIKYGRPIESRVRVVPAEAKDRTEAAPPLDLATRLRRNRRTEWARRMVRENVLTTDDLIWPLFVVEGSSARAGRLDARRRSPARRSTWCARPSARRKLGIPCVALFPYTDPSLRDEHGSEALNPDNLVCQRDPRHQEGGARDRRAVRRGARSLHQPRP